MGKSKRDLWKEIELLKKEIRRKRRSETSRSISRRRGSRSRSPSRISRRRCDSRQPSSSHRSRSSSRRLPHHRAGSSRSVRSRSHSSRNVEQRHRRIDEYRHPRDPDSPAHSVDRASNDSANANIRDHSSNAVASENDQADIQGRALREIIMPQSSTPPLLIHNDVELSDDYLQVLGEDPNDNKSISFDLHPALCSRWSHVLTQGVPKENQAELFSKHSPPVNCPALIPPKSNPEITAIMSVAYIKRDECHRDFQNQVSRGLSALGKGLNFIFEEGKNFPESFKDKLLPPLVDAGRILSNLYYNISQTRRSLIMPILSKSVKETVGDTLPGELLFGPELGEKIKATRTLERIGKDLRPAAQQVTPINFSAREKKRGGEHSRPRTSYQPLNRRRPAHPRRDMRPLRGQPSSGEKSRPRQKR